MYFCFHCTWGKNSKEIEEWENNTTLEHVRKCGGEKDNCGLLKLKGFPYLRLKAKELGLLAEYDKLYSEYKKINKKIWVQLNQLEPINPCAYCKFGKLDDIEILWCKRYDCLHDIYNLYPHKCIKKINYRKESDKISDKYFKSDNYLKLRSIEDDLIKKMRILINEEK